MNKKNKYFEINHLLEKVFKKHGKGFINLKTFLSNLDKKELALLDLKRKSDQNAVESVLSPLTEPYRIRKYGGSKVLFNGPVPDVALEYIKGRKGRTFGQLNRNFPVRKGEFLDLVNGLLDRADLRVRISTTEKPVIYASGKKSERKSVEAHQEQAPQEMGPSLTDLALGRDSSVSQFKEAYDKVGKGSNYVFIHRIRNFLGWSRENFDALLYRMMREGYVAAHPGNPGSLTAEEVRDSFQDEYGDLYITVSWREPV